MKKLIKKGVGSALSLLFGHLPIKRNQVFFETCNGEVKDHLKAIYDYSKENSIQDFDFYWAIGKNVDCSHIEEKEVVYKKTLRYYYYLMTSQYWIRTHSVDNIVKKRKKQSYIQLWHGPGATKKEGFDLGIPDDGLPLYHTREWDYYLATDRASANYIKTATHINIPIILHGSCRADELIHSTKEDYFRLRHDMGIKDDEMVVLYAPTFRDQQLEDSVVHLPLKRICHRPKTRVILRLHPFVKNKLDIAEYGDQVILGDVFSEINSLYMMSDILITDYSSTAMDFSILKRPILYYAYDYDAYEVERGFYHNYLDHLSGPLVFNEDELLKTMDSIDTIREQYQEKEQAYYNLYNEFNDGKASERFIKMLKNGEFSKM